MRSITTFLALGAAAVLISGCGRQAAAQSGPAPAPLVTVAKVISRPITEFDEFTAHFEAVERVELRPRVSGYITSINFIQGRQVKKGEVLAVIDPRPYEAELMRAQAELAQARSQLELAQSQRARAIKLLAAHALSREEYDTDMANTQEADANMDAAAAALYTATLRSLRLQDIDRIAEQHCRKVRPRWEDRPSVWRQLLICAKSTEVETAHDFVLHALQLTASTALPKA